MRFSFTFSKPIPKFVKKSRLNYKTFKQFQNIFFDFSKNFYLAILIFTNQTSLKYSIYTFLSSKI